MKEKQIGWYHLKEDKVECNNGYECAAWYENIAVKAGRYPVYVYDYKVRDENRIDGHVGSAYVSIPGIIVDDYFGSLFCGVSVGTYDCERNKGKESYYHFSNYLFMVAESILKGNDEWELLPEYEARKIEFEYDGKMHFTHGIFLRRGIRTCSQ